MTMDMLPCCFALRPSPHQGTDISNPIRVKELHLHGNYPHFLARNVDRLLETLENLYEDGRQLRASIFYTPSPFISPVERPGIREGWTKEQRAGLIG
ncbi:hypothetical protein AN958_12887 [Leucoagaricus sp. SymC.cos]|nr:hypothetical protein AN958_12887 [Leucoagaricus sp. SymC.cos]